MMYDSSDKNEKIPGGIIILHKWKSYDIWSLRYEVQKTEFFYLGPFDPPKSPKMKISNEMKKTPGYIIILLKYTKNHDHRLYCSWDMACDGYNSYFPFWAILFPFTPLTAQKMKISKKWKKNPWIYHHFCTMYKKSWTYAILLLRYGAWQV